MRLDRACRIHRSFTVDIRATTASKEVWQEVSVSSPSDLPESSTRRLLEEHEILIYHRCLIAKHRIYCSLLSRQTRRGHGHYVFYVARWVFN